jgi:hypothetical protein
MFIYRFVFIYIFILNFLLKYNLKTPVKLTFEEQLFDIPYQISVYTQPVLEKARSNDSRYIYFSSIW